jgi:GntR family transcriptional repressor for pyruvate dehydrogenase complex
MLNPQHSTPAARRRSLIYETVIEQIKGELLSGRVQPGDRLPTVSAMAARMAVSPASVREAYRVLASMGLLEVTQGRGTFVTALPSDGASILQHFQLAERQSLAHLFESRLVLEPQIAALAAERASPAEIEALLSTARDQDRLQREGRDFLEPDIRFHELLLTAAHNPVMGRMVSAVNELLLESRRRTLRIPGASVKAASYHTLVALAVRDRNAGQARALMEQHVRDVAIDAGAVAPGDGGPRLASAGR